MKNCNTCSNLINGECVAEKTLPLSKWIISVFERGQLRKDADNCPSWMGGTPSQVDHPDHYGGASNPFEAIKVIEAWGLDFTLGNAVKYIARAGKKGSAVEDLEKAVWYLKRRISQLRGE